MLHGAWKESRADNPRLSEVWPGLHALQELSKSQSQSIRQNIWKTDVANPTLWYKYPSVSGCFTSHLSCHVLWEGFIRRWQESPLRDHFWGPWLWWRVFTSSTSTAQWRGRKEAMAKGRYETYAYSISLVLAFFYGQRWAPSCSTVEWHHTDSKSCRKYW